MGRKRTGKVMRAGKVDWLWKSWLAGTIVGVGLCALGAALIMAGVIDRAGIRIAGRTAAAAANVCAGVVCTKLSKERKLVRTMICCGGLTLIVLLVALALCGTAGGVVIWLASGFAAVLLSGLSTLGHRGQGRHRR